MKAYSLACALALTALVASAQNPDTDITVTHEVVPEEKAANRLHLTPTLNLPEVNRGRLSAATAPGLTDITPFFNTLGPVEFLTSATPTPWRGYAALAYGPVYNLSASAGYRFLNKERLSLDGYMQFNGMSQKSHFTKFENIYPDKVGLHRNTALVGANTHWLPAGNHGELTASLYYQFSGFNFPILDLPTATVDKHNLNVSTMKIDAGWKGVANKVDYSVSAGYNMICFTPSLSDYGGAFSGSILWHASTKSAWGFDLAYKITDSGTDNQTRHFFHSKIHYDLTLSHFRGSLGLFFDAGGGKWHNSELDRSYSQGLILPELKLQWLPSEFFNIWGQFSGKMVDNNRLDLFNEQPYLLPVVGDIFNSKLLMLDFGMTLGPWRGASIGVFGGFLAAINWFMPAYTTGELMPMDVSGWHGGVSFAYTFRRFFNVDVKAEWAQSPTDDFKNGYAFWRDHAGFNLVAKAAIHPIKPLEITLGYHLRTHRSKILRGDTHLNLLNISNLSASARYSITPQWSAFINAENLLNRHWYLGPSVPSQGLVCMVGATYKF